MIAPLDEPMTPPPGGHLTTAPSGSPGEHRRGLLAGARLYLCMPDRPDLERFAVACVTGGVDVVQLREKHLEARPLLERARRLRDALEGSDALLFLNDRPDLALEAGADGVHVGQDDAPPSLARRILGPEHLVGLSTHRASELEDALGQPIDYLSAGPVVPTPTKPGRPGTGLGYVCLAATRCRQVQRSTSPPAPSRLAPSSSGHQAGRDAPLPFFVTGNVTPEAIPRLSSAGASRFVAVRYLTEASDPATAARRLREAIEQALVSDPG